MLISWWLCDNYLSEDKDNSPFIRLFNLAYGKDAIIGAGGLSNNIFASRYISYISDKEPLIAQVEAVLKEWNKTSGANGQKPKADKAKEQTHRVKQCSTTALRSVD